MLLYYHYSNSMWRMLIYKMKAHMIIVYLHNYILYPPPIELLWVIIIIRKQIFILRSCLLLPKLLHNSNIQWPPKNILFLMRNWSQRTNHDEFSCLKYCLTTRKYTLTLYGHNSLGKIPDVLTLVQCFVTLMNKWSKYVYLLYNHSFEAFLA